MSLEQSQQAYCPDQTKAYLDFDGTLTTKDSLMPFLRYCAGDVVYYIKLVILSPILMGYLLKLIPNYIAKELVIGFFLKGWSRQSIQKKAQKFVRHKIPLFLLDAGMAKLQEHQKNGDFCVLVSASPEVYLQLWADTQGFDKVIATKFEFRDDIFTGKLLGRNCFGKEKVSRIESELGEFCWQDSFAYSDSVVDMPMISKSQHGFLLQENKNFSLVD